LNLIDGQMKNSLEIRAWRAKLPNLAIAAGPVAGVRAPKPTNFLKE
jgi:hypothetical protein